MVEIAFCLPIAMLFIFGIAWISFWLHAKSSLDSALNHSIRLAATRGVQETVGSAIIQDVQDFTNGYGMSTDLQDLLTYNVPWDSTVETYYDDLTEATFSSHTLQQLPPEYIYFYIYVGEALRQSVGDYVKYPCDPTEPDGAGCLSCAPLNPTTLDLTPTTDEPPRRSMGFECSFRPASVFLSPVAGLVKIISGAEMSSTATITRKVYYDMPGLLTG